MLFALDKNSTKVHIESAKRSNEYFCPCCGEKLILKTGDIRIHHFSHHRSSDCKDTWHYDMTEWHYNWQNKFPKEFQEVIKTLNEEKHRADVLIEKYKVVFEFQHSQLSPEEFEERNSFYNKLGYKVIWIFDVEEHYQNDQIDNYKGNLWSWKRPRRTFDFFDCKNKMVEVYLQLDNVDTCLVKVTWTTENSGISRFATDGYCYNECYFINMFNSDNEKIKDELKLSELYDKMIEINRKDHTTYYFGCPISKTHKCVDCTIDIPSSMYDEIMPCSKCKFQCENNDNYMEVICKKRFIDLGIDGNTIVKIEGKDKNGFINKISYFELNKKVIIDVPTFKEDYFKSVMALWDESYAVATFKNIRTGNYIRVNKDPKEQMLKYRKVYGWFSSDRYYFPKESRELYGVDKPEWIVVWNQKK